MPAKIDRPIKVTLALTVDHTTRFERLGVAMGQPLGTVTTVAATLGLNALEAMYGFKNFGPAIEAAIAPVATETANEMMAAGMVIPGKA
jgi:hypothetical protein